MEHPRTFCEGGAPWQRQRTREPASSVGARGEQLGTQRVRRIRRTNGALVAVGDCTLSSGLGARAGLESDRSLGEDVECLPIIREYAADQARFFRDFAEAYVKMGMLGVRPSSLRA